ncbi:alginate export family protein [Paraferrimonas sp. SM1919]|uniref:alginate export family protein n=1 Tax=Paraferrimonas sp. SM1919 TaxID=2662263 RepID=UPI0013D68180|nr:alginate export family protein [Paraferrimonas sp. SM1919]
MKANPIVSPLVIGLAAIIAAPVSADEAKASVDLRLRSETVQQDNPLKDASALTLRTRVNFQTQSYSGFNAVVEFEDVRTVAGVDNYNDAIGHNPQYSVIPDPATTELDQGFLQYTSADFKAKLGRQVIALDDQRFVGHVGWRQDRQTFDGISGEYTGVNDLKLSYAYVTKRNRIFAQAKDLAAKDHLINAAYNTPIGKLVGYGYLLEVDNDTKNNLDTFGASLTGKKTDFSYSAQFASQTNKTDSSDYKANYYMLEGGYGFAGITAKVGYEVLGSDNGQYGFATPLATLHKFNGWADQFLGTPKQGLKDLYAGVFGKLYGGNWAVVYHDYRADHKTDSIDDLGSEINASYGKAFAKRYSAGVKLASYKAGDAAAGKVNTDKLWVWLGAKF